jgi:hypothetical protein
MMAHRAVQLTIALLALTTAGCLEVREHLTLNADGSGTLVIETSCLVRTNTINSLRSWRCREANAPFYPPLCEAHARELFPGKGLTVDVKPNPDKNAVSGVAVLVTFQDVNTLLESPYGRARSLWVGFEGDRLVVRARPGVLAAVLAAESRTMQGYAGDPKLAEKRSDMTATFTLTLPNAVAETDGKADGRTATWLLDRSGTKTLDEAVALFRRPMRAACTREGVGFTPRPVLRLDDASFAELREGPTGRALPLPGVADVAKAVRFVPHSITVQKTFDLTGENSYHENASTFAGVVTVPRELAPAGWGSAVFEEILDDRGRSLKLVEGRRHWYGGSRFLGSGAEATLPDGHVRHAVNVQFQVPEPSVKAIRTLRGRIELRYFATQSVTKLADAIGEKAPVPATGGPPVPFDEGDGAAPEDDKAIPKIEEVERSEESIGFMVTLPIRESVAFEQAQCFDAHGEPWPTLTAPGGNGAYVAIPGKPKFPVSLALLLKTGAKPVTVPLRLDNLRLERKARPTPGNGKQE